MTKLYQRSDRDQIIDDAYELVLQCDLYPHTAMRSDTDFSRIEHGIYLHLSWINTEEPHKRRVFLRIPGGNSIFRAVVEDNTVEIMNKNGVGTITYSLDSTEEECFQSMLVSDEAIEYTTLQKINAIIEYGLANYEE